jgi:hypothetical protein
MTRQHRIEDLEAQFGNDFLTDYHAWRREGVLPENDEHTDKILRLELFLAEANLSMEGTDYSETLPERERRAAPLLEQIQRCEDARGEPGPTRDRAREELGEQQRHSHAAEMQQMRELDNLPFGDEDLPAPQSPD